MDNWEWPQWLLAGWWASTFCAMIGVTVASNFTRGWVQVWHHWINVIMVIAILYAGGFWS